MRADPRARTAVMSVEEVTKSIAAVEISRGPRTSIRGRKIIP